jgi:hypothetical protein
MGVVTCTFQVDDAAGGDLSGPWFDNGSAGTSNTTGQMKKGQNDELFVVLQWNAGNESTSGLSAALFHRTSGGHSRCTAAHNSASTN